ncbi:pci domain-containing protein, partial [Cystoisospora suis]
KLLTSPKYGLSTDPYISLFIPDLLRCLRLHALPSILAPYSRVSFHCLQEELQTDSREEVISLLHEAISTCRIRGVIDDVQGVFVHYRRETRSSSSLVSSRSSSSSSSLLTSRGPVSQEKKRENRMIKNSEKRGEEPIHDDEDNEKEEEESIPREESVLKDWVDSLSSLTRNLSLASPFGGGSTVSTMSTVSPMSTMKSTMSTLSSSSSPSLGTVKQTKITSQTDTSMA